MKQNLHLSNWLLAIILSLCSALSAYAATYVSDIGNLKYNLDTESQTAEVRSKVNSNYLDVVIPATVNYHGETYKVTAIARDCFSGCSNMTSITLPESITSLGNRCFSGCSSLKSITLPDGTTSLGDWCFSGCSSLKSVYVSWNTPLVVSSYAFVALDKSSCTLYVPTGAVDNYRQADVWKDFKNIAEYNPTGINNAITNSSVRETNRYSANGQIMETTARGMNIVKYSDGSVKKIMVP